MRTLLSALFLCVLSQVVGAQACADLEARGEKCIWPTAAVICWDKDVWCLAESPIHFHPFGRHVELPSIDPLPCQSKAVGLGIGFRPCAKLVDEHPCYGRWENGHCHVDGWTGVVSGDIFSNVQSGGDSGNVIVGSDGRWACKRKRGVKEPFECYPTIAAVAAFAQPTGVEGDNGTMEAYERDVPAIGIKDHSSAVKLCEQGEKPDVEWSYCYATRWTCTDQTRFLLQRGDGQWRCIKF